MNKETIKFNINQLINRLKSISNEELTEKEINLIIKYLKSYNDCIEF